MNATPSLQPTPEELAAAKVKIIARPLVLNRQTNIFYVGVTCLQCDRRWREAQTAMGFVNSKWWRCPKGCNWLYKYHPGLPDSWSHHD